MNQTSSICFQSAASPSDSLLHPRRPTQRATPFPSPPANRITSGINPPSHLAEASTLR